MAFQLMHQEPATVDHEVTGSYPGLNVTGLEAYSARALVMSLGRKDDVVRLPRNQERTYRVYERYVTKELELDLPRVRFSDEPGAYLNGPFATHHPFVFRINPQVLKQRPELRVMKGIQDFFEDKNNWIRESQANGPTAPETYFYSRKGREDTIPLRLHGKWWVKVAISATGDGSWLLSGAALWSKIAKLKRLGIDFQVQEHIPGIVCSAQCWVGESGGVVLTTSDQMMANGKTHTGNVFPSQFDQQLRKRAEQHAGHLWRAGYRGYCGFDFIFIKADGVYDLEANMRPGGGHYGAAVAGALGIEECMSVMVSDLRDSRLRDPATLMRHLRKCDLLWTQRHQHGVIPWCISTVPSGKVMLLIPAKGQVPEHVLRAFRFECCKSK